MKKTLNKNEQRKIGLARVNSFRELSSDGFLSSPGEISDFDRELMLKLLTHSDINGEVRIKTGSQFRKVTGFRFNEKNFIQTIDSMQKWGRVNYVLQCSGHCQGKEGLGFNIIRFFSFFGFPDYDDEVIEFNFSKELLELLEDYDSIS